MSDWLVDQLTAAFGGYQPTDHELGTIVIIAQLS